MAIIKTHFFNISFEHKDLMKMLIKMTEYQDEMFPQEVLRRFNLVTKECQENKMSYQDLLITRKGYRLSKEDEGFIRAIKCSIKEINI